MATQPHLTPAAPASGGSRLHSIAQWASVVVIFMLGVAVSISGARYVSDTEEARQLTTVPMAGDARSRAAEQPPPPAGRKTVASLAEETAGGVPKARVVLSLGLLISTLLAAYLASIIHRERVISHLVAERTRQLARSEVYQQAILRSAHYAIVSTDVNGTIRDLNPAAEEMLALPAAAAIGQWRLEQLPASEELVLRAQELSAELQEDIAPNFAVFAVPCTRAGYDDREWTFVRGDGSRVPVLLSVTALRDDDAAVSGFVGIAYDLTERQKIDQLKRDFVSTVSHELRTPLTSLRAAIGMLADGTAGELPSAASQLLHIAEQSSGRLSRLINDLLDMERIEAGQVVYHLAPVPLKDLVEQAIAANRPYAESYQVHLTRDSNCPATCPAGCKLRVDSDRFAQIMANLISNAAKFSPPGSEVHIAAHCNRQTAAIEIADRGPGIPLEFQPRLFEKFSQADSSSSRAQGGTGLGLAITKGLVEHMGGRIGFRSDPQGTTFRVEFPTAPPASVGDERPAAGH